ncbi:hypothetical protein Tco_0769877 [Tanacetum coccineum]|uniref:Uncharacterized protein n=1 Tax=Tanacetum coccineum TaxID=301880 RepID=A0ABQ4ZD79_9ASTR
MITINSQKDSVSPLPLAAKLKKGKSQNMTPTLPKSQGPEAPGALSKKRQKPKSKKPPTKTKVTPPKPIEGSEQSHSVSSSTVPDPQDLERNIQLASTGLPSTLDEGTHETQSTRLRYQTLTKNKGKTSSEVEPNTEPLKLQTFADVQAFLLSEDELDKESDEEEVLAVREDMDEDPQVAEEVRTPSPKQDQPEPSHSPVKDVQAHALKQEEVSAAWTKSSTNMAWNLGSRINAIEISQTALKCEVSSLR